MDKNMRDIIESLAFIKERMVTKDELAEVKDDVATLHTELHEFREEVRAEYRSIHHELALINRRLDKLKENHANLKGVTKEIDDLRADVRAIEKHLGINKKIAV